MYRMTGAELVIRLLERQNISTIAGIPGGANLPLYDALSHSPKIKHILARHEQGAGFMAQGMARVTASPQVFFATSGPGATNTLTALADARLDSIPVICITGQVASPMIGTDAFQEVDIYGMSVPITKHNFLVRTVEELLTVIPQAFRIASSDRPGPVLVDIPKDVQTATIEFEDWPDPGQPNPHPELEMEQVVRAADMINKAKKPILYVGGGVVQSGASDQAMNLAEKISAPTVMTLMGLGTIPGTHPLCLGMLGMHAAPCTNIALEECDLLIAVGVRFDDRATGKVSEFCPSAKVVHIDIDPGELDKIRKPSAGIIGDAKEALKQLLPMVSSNNHQDWNTRVDSLKKSHPMLIMGEDDPMTPYGIITETARAMGPEAVVATDVGQHQMRTAQAHPYLAPRKWLTSGGLGTMGFGVPAAIGACLAHPDKPVACFTGDGSIMMNIQELATAVEHNVNLKIILCNNNALGLVQQQQELFYGNRKFASDYAHAPDFAAIARGFGLKAVDLSCANDPKQALQDALAAPGPCLISVPLKAENGVYPMVPPGAANREMIGGEAYACAE